MALSDYFNGPQHKAKASQLEAELQTSRQQQQAEAQAHQAKCDALMAELQASREQHCVEKEEFHAKYKELMARATALGLMDKLAVEAEIAAEKARLVELETTTAATMIELESTRVLLADAQRQILGAEETVLLESFGLYLPKYRLTNSVEYKDRLEKVREEQKQTARGISAEVDKWDNHAVELTKTQWKKLRKDAFKLALRSFNSESEYCVDHVKFNNVEKMEERIKRSFETCNKLLASMDILFREIVLNRKLEELYLAHEYELKRQEEKEAIRQAREDQREQDKLEKEIREARAKIDKERRHFTSALQSLQLRLVAASAENERQDLESRIGELSNQRSRLDDEERLIDYREQSARAGYVYVISNIGAFGEGVFKIGMTRRLEPMDRVDELGDASVPFRFDVHAMVFSDNAPVLEAKLHAHFAVGRLNKVNGRKEFFRADLKEVEAVIRGNYDAVVEVVHAAPADQFRESLRLTMPLESIQLRERLASTGQAPAME